MSVCTTIDAATGYVIATSTPISECTTYVLLNPLENIANGVFSIPPATDLAGFWAAGFVLPCSIGLIAWCVGKVANF